MSQFICNEHIYLYVFLSTFIYNSMMQGIISLGIRLLCIIQSMIVREVTSSCSVIKRREMLSNARSATSA